MGNTVKAAHEVEETVEHMKETVREGYETAKAKVAEVGEKAHEVWDKAADTSLNDVHDSVKAYVGKNPGTTLLAAAGVGLLVGLLIRGHRH